MNLLFTIISIISIFTIKHENKKHILFIVNPISHEIRSKNIEQIIKTHVDTTQFDYEITCTRFPEHATQLAKAAGMRSDVDIVAAIGGDGTVNEVATALIGSNKILAIIPAGSGNGLARHLGIPTSIEDAIEMLHHAHPIRIDTASVNKRPFLGIAGIGFDAHVAWKFAERTKRGLATYGQIALQEFPKYHEDTYLFTIDGAPMEERAIIMGFANSCQYGNDFIIAPQAHLQDGYLDLILVKNIPAYAIPSFLYQCKKGHLDTSPYIRTLRFKELILEKQTLRMHLDGEPILFKEKICVRIHPASLSVMVTDTTCQTSPISQ